MGRIVVSENVSLDGVAEDPSGAEGFRLGGWVGLIRDREELGALLLDEALAAEALLLGRRTYEFFAARWPARSGPLADRLNALRKYVVSSTLARPEWNNSTVLHGDVPAEISKVRQSCQGDIVVYGSIELVSALMDRDLVDELRLLVYPVVLGAGRRLFARAGDETRMHLIEARAVGGDIAFLAYRRSPDT